MMKILIISISVIAVVFLSNSSNIHAEKIQSPNDKIVSLYNQVQKAQMKKDLSFRYFPHRLEQS